MGELNRLESRYGAANYKPLPVTLVRGEGVHVWDEDGRRYLDMMGAYSAVSFGHCHANLVKAMTRQARRRKAISTAAPSPL
jgi:ornithine--oxo-acid transaminase